jgi:hypothetical protein
MELSEPTQIMGPNVEAMTITMHPTSQKLNSRLSSNNTSPKLLMEIPELVGTENPNSEETTRTMCSASKEGQIVPQRSSYLITGGINIPLMANIE